MGIIKDTFNQASTSNRFRLQSIIALLVFTLSFIYLAQSYNYGLIIGDEGYLTAGTMRIIDGEIPYIDNWQNYSPGRFYLFALLFKLLGPNLLIIRKFWVLLNALASLLAFLLARRVMPLWTSLIPPVLLTVIPSPMHKSFFVFIPLLNLYMTALYLEKKVTPFWYGYVAGLTILFRQDVGIAGVFVGMATIGIGSMRDHEKKTISFETTSFPLSAWTRLYLGVMAAVAPLIAYFWMHSGLNVIVSQLLLSGLNAQKGKAIAFPALTFLMRHSFHLDAAYLLLIYYMPFVIYAATLVFLIRRLPKKGNPTGLILLTMVLMTGLLILPQALIRSDPPHMLQVLPPYYLLLAYWIHRSQTAMRHPSASREKRTLLISNFVFLAGVVSYLCLYSICLGYNLRSPFFTKFSKRYHYRILNNTRASLFLPEPQFETVDSLVHFASDHTGKEDYLLCMPYCSIFNFLSERKNPSRYDIFLPGEMDSSRRQQQEIIRSMESRRLSYIFMEVLPLDGIEDRIMKTYMPFVYQYISDNFTVERRIGSYDVLRRTHKSLPNSSIETGK